MHDSNPFRETEFPQLGAEFPQAGADHGSLMAVDRQLAGMRGWTMFVAVMGFIVGGLLAVLALGLVVFMGVGGAGRGPFGGAFLLVGAVYLGVAAIYLVGSYWLALFSNRTAQYLRHRTSAGLDEALRAQKSFWKYCGILAIVAICLMLGAFCVAFVFSAGF